MSTQNFRANGDLSFGFSDSEPYFPHATRHLKFISTLYNLCLPYFNLMISRQKKLSSHLLSRAQRFQMQLAEKSPILLDLISDFKIEPFDTTYASPEKLLLTEKGVYSYIYLEKFRLLEPMIKKKKKCNIAIEIGSGCGFMAHLICKHLNPRTVFLIDHLGPNIYAHDYLDTIESLGYAIKIQQDSELEINPNENQIIILTPRQIRLLESVQPEVLVNFTSLCLMQDYEREMYIDLLQNNWAEATLLIGHAGPWNDPLQKIQLQDLCNLLDRPIIESKRLYNLDGSTDGGAEYFLLK